MGFKCIKIVFMVTLSLLFSASVSFEEGNVKPESTLLSNIDKITVAKKAVKTDNISAIKNLNLGFKAKKLNSIGSIKPDINFGKIPLYFIANEGQVNEKVRFYAKASRYTLWLTNEGLVFDSSHRKGMKQHKKPGSYLLKTKNENYGRDISKLIFVGANKNPEIQAIEPTNAKVNYFKGRDKSSWQSNIPTFKAVLYKNIYKNIDLKVYGIEEQIEYDWIVRPGGNPQEIRFAYKNVKFTRIDNNGNLIIETRFGELMHKKPVSFQVKNEKIPIKVDYKKVTMNVYGFKVSNYDKCNKLIIDPVVMVYSSYFDGGATVHGYSIDVDQNGNVYLTGGVFGSEFPTVNPYQSENAGGTLHTADVFLSKLSPDGQSLIYSTYFGGSAGEYGKSIAVDGNGCPYITGYTYSWDLPTLNAYQGQNGGYNGSYDAFLVKFSNDGQSLIYSTYLGGEDQDLGYDVAVDSSGSAYITGRTLSVDFPTYNPFQSNMAGNGDGFLTKLSTDGQSLIYSTYFGGSKWDEVLAVDVDSQGSAYITGFTVSTDFPLKNAFQDQFSGVCDMFVSKFKPDGSDIVYSSYLGGSNNDRGYDIKVNSNKEAIVVGNTYSQDFPLKNSFQNSLGGSCDACFSQISTDGNQLVLSSYWGGTEWDGAYCVALGTNDVFYIAGLTFSIDFPTLNAYQNIYNKGIDDSSGDAFIASFTPSQILCSSFIGGSKYDTFFDVAAGSNNCCYFIGFSWSDDFPIYRALEPISDGFDNTVFLKFDMSSLTPVASTNQLVRRKDTSLKNSQFKNYVSNSIKNQEITNNSFTYNPSRLKWPIYRQTNYGMTTEHYNQVLRGSACAHGDIDGDGDIDIILSAITRAGDDHGSGDAPADEIIILVNDNGFFTDETDKRLTLLNYYGAPRDIELGDVDNDGDLDLLLGCHNVEYYSINYNPGEQDRLLINNGAGYFSDETLDRLPKDLNSFTHCIEFGDIDNDGDLDIFNGSKGEIWRNDGQGIYSIDTTNYTFGYSTGAAFGDLNNDNFLDIVTTTNVSTIRININDGSGGFFQYQWISNSNNDGYQPVIADFNNDGLNDFFVANAGEYKPDRLFLNQGSLNFADSTSNLNQGTPPQYSWHTTAGDVDNDGDVDLFLAVVSNETPDCSNPVGEGCYESSRFYENLGNGIFQDSSSKIPSVSQCNQILLADYNGDGYLDAYLDSDIQCKVFINTTLAVLSPQGGESWKGASTQNITWTSIGPISNVKIEYSIDNGSTWTTETVSTPNDGSYTWIVPNISSIQCLVKISDAVDGTPSDTSDAVFTIIPSPSISLDRTSLYFGAESGSTTSDQSFLVSNSGGGSLNWSITDDAAWLTCSPTSGTGTATLTVSVDPTGLSAGTYNGYVTVTDPNATNSPQTISVTLKVYNAGSTSVPFGSFDTPINNSDVFGSVPVTGWALDDIEVETLLVKREPVASDPPEVIGPDGLVFIGNGVFVEGSRPDVEAIYSTYPLCYRAGWGYMLLTNALPNGGNGTFVLHAIAYDKDGHKVDLGTKTINVDNANSVMPFGAIDTPKQGGEASGSSYVNFGWALTPVPNTIVNGTTSVNVLIDSVIVGNATYGDYRSDIEAKYPGYNNSDGAGGHFYIDTTTYANGVHTISWHVRDDASNVSGIGSRFFSIVNTGSGSTQQKITSTKYIVEDTIKDYQRDYGVIRIKRGIDRIEEPEEKYTDDKGYYIVEMREVERLVIELNREEENTIYEGYMKFGNELRRLPIGSTLDKQKGIFYWEPGPGFIGEYELVFINLKNNSKKNIKILIKPKFEKRIVE